MKFRIGELIRFTSPEWDGSYFGPCLIVGFVSGSGCCPAHYILLYSEETTTGHQALIDEHCERLV